MEFGVQGEEAWILGFRVKEGLEFGVQVLGFRVQGEEFRAWGLVFGVWCLVFGVWCLVFGVWCLGFGVWGLGFGIWGLGFEVWGFEVWGSGFELSRGSRDAQKAMGGAGKTLRRKARLSRISNIGAHDHTIRLKLI